MMFFGAELFGVYHNESYSNVWLTEDQVRRQCAERLSIETKNNMEQDIGASE
jgi:hypothetical protein